MAKILKMPKLSDTMEEGAVASWLKKEGDFVEEGAPICEIETDKATMEYASPYEGYLLKILVPAGKGTALNSPMAVLGEKGEKYSLEDAKPATQPAAAAHKPATQQAPIAKAPTPAPTVPTEGRTKISPLARKIVQERGLDVAQLQGSGPGGRIIKRDVEGAPRHAAAGAAGRRYNEVSKEIPLTMMRKTIAKRLTEAKQLAPHFYLTISVNTGALDQWRSVLNTEAKLKARQGIKISMNDLLMFVTARALLQHPMVNSSWGGEAITQHGAVHLCMAVALPTGLVTPVLRNAHRLPLSELATQAKAYGAKARDGKLTPDEYTGGTFTISNLGMTCVEEFTAIINPPQACILAVGRSQKVPWVNQAGQLEVQSRMKLTLSCDHRVVDGMVGAQFLGTLQEMLENPLLILEDGA